MCETRQNPGDVRVPEGQALTPFQKVLVIDEAAYADPTRFDKIEMLPGSPCSDKDERAAREATTFFP